MVTPDLIYMLIEQEAHLSRRETCKGDDYHGSCVSYYDTGQLKSLEFYREGDLHGTARYFDRRGAVKVEHTYLEGKIYEHQLLENFSKKAHRNQDNIPPMQAKAYQNPACPPQAFTEENMQVDFLYKAPRTGNIVRLSHHSAGEVTFEEVDALLGKIHMQPYFSFPEY